MSYFFEKNLNFINYHDLIYQIIILHYEIINLNVSFNNLKIQIKVISDLTLF